MPSITFNDVLHAIDALQIYMYTLDFKDPERQISIGVCSNGFGYPLKREIAIIKNVTKYS